MTLFVAMVEHEGKSESFIQAFWSNAPTLGAAIDRIVAGTAVVDLPTPWFIAEMDPYRDQLPSHAVQVLEDVWQSDTRHAFPASASSFRLPRGVVKSCLKGDFDLEEIVPGFHISEHDRSIRISAVIEAEGLLDAYLALVRTLGTYQVSWIKLHDDWDDAGEIAYVNESINRGDLLESFLAKYDMDVMANGHVTITAFAAEGSTNVNLSDHKTIEIWSTSREQTNALITSLHAAGIPSTERLVAIDQGFHHWHYRPGSSRDRAGLIAALKDDGFTPWQPKPLARPKG